MGMTRETFDFFIKYIEDNNSICQFGDQQFMCCAPYKELTWVQDSFKQLGFKFVSIDVNGKGGALPIDLDYEIDTDIVGTFDIVTDFGTTEHCGNVYMVMKNAHKLCKVGGIILHVLPTRNNWPSHCNFWFDIDTFTSLVTLVDYETLELFNRKLNIGGDDSIQTHVAFRKLSERFPSEEEFNKIVKIYYK